MAWGDHVALTISADRLQRNVSSGTSRQNVVLLIRRVIMSQPGTDRLKMMEYQLRSLDTDHRSAELHENPVSANTGPAEPRSVALEGTIRSIEKRLQEINSEETERLLSMSRTMSSKSHVNHSLFHERTSIGWTQHFWEIGKRAQEKRMEESNDDEVVATSFHSIGPADKSHLSSDGRTDLELINVLWREVSLDPKCKELALDRCVEEAMARSLA